MGSRHSPGTTFIAWNGDTSGGVAVVLEEDRRHPHARRTVEGAHEAGLAGDVTVADRLEAGWGDLQHDALDARGVRRRRDR